MNNPTNKNIITGKEIKKKYYENNKDRDFRPPEVDQEFPADAFPPEISEVCRHIAEAHNLYSPILPLMTGLATVSGALGRSVIARNGALNYETPPNIMIAVAANPGSGKGACRELIRPLQKRSEELANEWLEKEKPRLDAQMDEVNERIGRTKKRLEKLSENSTENERAELREILVKSYQERQLIESQLKRKPALWIEVTTTAGLLQMLRDQTAEIYSVSLEGGDLVRTFMGKHSGGQNIEIDILLKGYANEEYRDTKAGRGDTLIVPCIACLWLFQPWIRDELLSNPEVYERGLTARLQIVSLDDEPTPRDTGNLPPLDKELLDKWRHLIRELLDLRFKCEKEPWYLECTPAAREAFTRFHNEIADFMEGEYADVSNDLTRCRENAIRIALIFAIVENKFADTVEERHATAAIRIVRWIVFNSIDQRRGAFERALDGKKDALRTLLRQRSNKQETVRKLRLHHNFKREDLRVLCSRFPQEFEWVPGTSKPRVGGRPSPVVRIVSQENPSETKPSKPYKN